MTVPKRRSRRSQPVDDALWVWEPLSPTDKRLREQRRERELRQLILQRRADRARQLADEDLAENRPARGA